MEQIRRRQRIGCFATLLSFPAEPRPIDFSPFLTLSLYAIKRWMHSGRIFCNPGSSPPGKHSGPSTGAALLWLGPAPGIIPGYPGDVHRAL